MYIEEVKNEIEEYHTKIEDLMSVLRDISTKNMVKQPKVYFDKNLFESQMNNPNELVHSSFPIFLVVFFCCIGMFVGKFLHRLI
jgi:hypothetical protein